VAVTFEEQRYEIGAGYVHQLSNVRVGGSGRASYEPDYTSLFAGARAEVDLLEKNVVLGAGASVGRDWVGQNVGDGTTEDVGRLTTLLGSLSASQIVSRTAVVAVTYDASRLSGYQENPYRTAIAGDTFTHERHPDLRWRHAVAATLRAFVPRTETTVIASYRFYGDTWHLFAHTPELRIVQSLGTDVELRLRYRFHRQDAADFYQLSYEFSDEERQPFLTGDAKLSPFSSHVFGGKLVVRLSALGLTGNLADARGELIVERVLQYNDFGHALTAHAALTVPLDY